MLNACTWRGVDLAPRRAKISKTYRLDDVTNPEDVPIVINSPCYFAFGNDNFPPDYFSNPATMVEYQEQGYEKHLMLAHDDFIPYFMPWFGTGILPSAFGCQVTAPMPGKDPAVSGPCLLKTSDIAKLKMPDPEKDGWMPRVLNAIDYARAHSDLPVGLTDIQGPLDTAGLMCGHDNLFTWMYEDPAAVEDLLDIVTDALIAWVKVQKAHIGEALDESNGLQGVWSPKGVGIWLSEDDVVMASPDVLMDFVVPRISRVFEAFGGGCLHYCGRGTQHMSALHEVKNLRAISNSPMGDFEAYAELQKEFAGKVTLHVQDIAPLDVETYYKGLFKHIEDLRGLMFTTFVVEGLAINETGACVRCNRDSFDTINRIVGVVRESVSEILKQG